MAHVGAAAPGATGGRGVAGGNGSRAAGSGQRCRSLEVGLHVVTHASERGRGRRTGSPAGASELGRLRLLLSKTGLGERFVSLAVEVLRRQVGAGNVRLERRWHATERRRCQLAARRSLRVHRSRLVLRLVDGVVRDVAGSGIIEIPSVCRTGRGCATKRCSIFWR